MFRNIAAAAWHAARRDGLSTLLGILSLALGLAAALVIGLYIRGELAYERDLTRISDIYRVQLTVLTPDRPPETVTMTPSGMGRELKLDFPQITYATRLARQQVALRAGQVIRTEMAQAVDSDYFRVVSRPLLRGSPSGALAEPDSVVISAALAQVYFGTVDCIGRAMQIDGVHPVRVTGVLAPPAKTMFDFPVLIAGNSRWSRLAILDAAPAPAPGDLNTTVVTMVRLPRGSNPAGWRSRLDRFVATHYPPDPRDPADTFRVWLRPLASLHLQMDNPDTEPAGTALTALVALGLTGLLIIGVAAVNFVNLMTACATTRALEVGVRKALGGSRLHLMVQFIGESAAFALAALLLAVLAVTMLLPHLNASLGKSLPPDFWRSSLVDAAMVGCAEFVGVAAGLYPALVQSAFSPAQALQSRAIQLAGSGVMRRGLVVGQFAVAITLVIGTVVIFRQTRFATNQGMTFKTGNIVNIALGSLHGEPGWNDAVLDGIKARIGAVPGVRASAGSWIVMAADAVAVDGVSGIDTPHHGRLSLNRVPLDYGFFELFALRPMAGRSFSPELGDAATPLMPQTGSGTAIINETALHRLGFGDPHSAIGHHLLYADDDPGGHGQVREIIGVMPDMQVDSVRNPVPPTVFFAAPRSSNWLSVKIDRANMARSLAAIDRIWDELVPARPINRQFMDERVAALYRDIDHEGKMFTAFAVLAAFLCLLGLFGLASFSAQRRTREIGTRKALGAPTLSIVLLLMRQFVTPVLFSLLLAWPVSWWLMRKWLDGFAYRIPLDPALFLLTGLAAVAVALLTTTLHTGRAARALPIDALRHD